MMPSQQDVALSRDPGSKQGAKLVQSIHYRELDLVKQMNMVVGVRLQHDGGDSKQLDG